MFPGNRHATRKLRSTFGRKRRGSDCNGKRIGRGSYLVALAQDEVAVIVRAYATAKSVDKDPVVKPERLVVARRCSGCDGG